MKSVKNFFAVLATGVLAVLMATVAIVMSILPYALAIALGLWIFSLFA